jgi:hypothetical protein
MGEDTSTPGLGWGHTVPEIVSQACLGVGPGWHGRSPSAAAVLSANGRIVLAHGLAREELWHHVLTAETAVQPRQLRSWRFPSGDR